MKDEKQKLEENVSELKQINRDLSLEIGESKSTILSCESAAQSEASEWSEEKEKLSEQTVVMVSSKNEEVLKQYSAVEKNPKETPPLPPKPQQDNLSAELTRLQLSFFKEKKAMMEKQKGLEQKLREALSVTESNDDKDDKENSTRETPTKRVSKLLPPTGSSEKRVSRPPSRPKMLSGRTRTPSPGPKLPLSPSGQGATTRRSRIALDSPVRRRGPAIDPE